ncbi:phage tail tape measure protein [Streptococcus suis]|nr:phage tail tape measure protein [Streptococcus suis]NRG54238.1 phage tail tape measure protein [Streptococcus suis]WNF83076.1 phage tail tape measure protein [Streptococcus suis]
MGASNLGDLVATATLDISPFATNTNQLKMLVRGLDSQLKIVENSFKGQKNKLEGLKASHTQLGKVLEGNRALFANQARHYQNLKMETGSLNTATKEQKIQLLGAKNAMEATAAKVAELQNKYNALAREIATQSSVWTKIGTNLAQSGNELKAFGDAAAGVGKALTAGLTVPIMAGAGYAVKAAVQYESAFAGVKKTVDETATTSYEKLSNSIRQMSKELPASAVEIANVAEVAGQLGIKADNITDFTKVMIDLGESTNMSATVAAESLAKFANITKLAPENYSRLGASIVELGNNFATTEADITAMASRLAGAGAQIGLSQADVIGLSAALSSVGIEAEMGGSAFSKMMVKMQLAATSGAKGMAELTAKTGVSRREFELMLANSPKDFKKLADSIGMTSTEMSNIVKASANLEDFARISGMTVDEFVQKFEKDAVGAIGAFINGLGNAEESGESAIEMLNEMGFTEVRLRDALLRAGNAQDLFTSAINMSNDAWDENKALTNEANKRYETTEAKLKMLRNEVTDVAIEFGGPLVDALRDGLEAVKPWLKSAPDMAKAFSKLDKEQQQQIIKWGLIAASAGPALSVLGNGISVTGSIFKGLGKVSTVLGKVSGALQTGTPLMSAFSGATTTATAASGGLASAVGLLGNPVTWGVLLGGVAIATIGYFAQKALEARQRTEEWGTEVDKVQAVELTKFKDKVDESTKAMEAFGTSGKDDVEAVKTAFQELVGEIESLTNKELAKDLKLAEKWGLSQEQIDRMKKTAQQGVDNAQAMSDQVIAIYKNANEQRRALTEEEYAIVLNNQTELINKQLSLLEYSGQEKEAITKAMNGRLEELNSAQLSKAMQTTVEWLKEENKAYKTSKDELKEIYEAGGYSLEEYNAKVQTLTADHNAKMDAYTQKYVDIRKRMDEVNGRSLASSLEQDKYFLEAYKNALENLGISYDDYARRMENATTRQGVAIQMLARYSQDMTEASRAAATHWNALVFDEKTGKLKTNAEEEVQKAAQSQEGWNQLIFDLKHAELDSNARQVIVEASESAGHWNELTVHEKQMIVNGNQAMIEMATSQEMLNQWVALTPEQKQLLAVDMTANPTQSAQVALDKVKQTRPADIFASDKTATETASAQRAIDNVLQRSPAQILADNRTSPEVSAAQRAIDSIYQQSPVSINASDYASGVAAGVRDQIYSIPDYKLITIEAVRRGEAGYYAQGTNYHPGGLAMVNDQKGSLYRELVTLPSGESFIPEGRNVVLPLPRGTRVLKASDTKKLFPHYADGIGFEDTGIARLARRMNNVTETSVTNVIQTADDALLKALSELLSITREGNSLAARLISQGLGISLSIDGEVGISGPRYNELVNAVSQAIAQELQRKMMLKGMAG